VTSHLLPTYARVDLAFERGEGTWLFATNGERYLDFTAGLAVNALGYAHPRLIAAFNGPEIADAVDRIERAAGQIERAQRKREQAAKEAAEVNS
jgi:acetylornithine/succinyldiaminopimelate/putrescine aminotransferase